ncbi:MAG TPA: hypothetical protein P5572_17275 [Phycisphaerae bacterium]|nr:hypothetical protein [Phycisphaerales bacterium]HRX86780.1 hypothetical protein [Phycisphaerae bacterium]
MVTLKVPISVEQLVELARQLPPDERRTLLDALLAERFDVELAEQDRLRGSQSQLSDEQIQTEVDAVRRARRQERHRAGGG